MAWFRNNPPSGNAQRDGTAVLLVNLGTPQAPTARAVRPFLARFLRDRRVVDLPPLLWWPLLYGLVLPLRPYRSARAYRKIWTPQGSPLAQLTAELARKLQARVDAGGPERMRVAYAMCYSAPGVAEGLRALATSGCERLVVLPLYPQHSSSTTGSVFDQVTRELARWRRVPELSFVSHYYDHPAYIEALAASVRTHWASATARTPLLFSFHGIPARSVTQGDPYFEQCHETARLVADSLGLARGAWSVSFQSRFGRTRWLEPGTGDELIAHARRGADRITVLAPSFAVDCLETLEEIAIGYRALYLAAGGRDFQYIPALNARDEHVRALLEVVGEHLRGRREAALEPRKRVAR
jgi:ferrochelatase